MKTLFLRWSLRGIIIVSISLNSYGDLYSNDSQPLDNTLGRENVNYASLKDYHIQQDLGNGCSLATATVLINSIKSDEKTNGPMYTQAELREWLKTKNGDLKYWYNRVKPGGSGVSLYQYRRYLSAFLEEMGVDFKLVLNQRSSFSFNTFKNDLIEASESENVYLLFNYSGHWSPLGLYDDEAQEFMILDVDWDEKYGKEYHYDRGEGEDIRRAYSFYRNWSRRRGYLKITINPPMKLSGN